MRASWLLTAVFAESIGLYISVQAYMTANTLHRSSPKLPLGLWRSVQERETNVIGVSEAR